MEEFAIKNTTFHWYCLYMSPVDSGVLDGKFLHCADLVIYATCIREIKQELSISLRWTLRLQQLVATDDDGVSTIASLMGVRK
jgi:hypothetical protein